MRKRYLIILTGLILSFALLTGCGMTRTAEQSQTSDVSSTQREEELQAEIDALQQEIDELKGAQDQQDTATSAKDEQTSDNSQTAYSGSDSIPSSKPKLRVLILMLSFGSNLSLYTERLLDLAWLLAFTSTGTISVSLCMMKSISACPDDAQ